MHQALDILRSGEAILETTGYDNWNVGTDIYTLYIRIAPDVYARLAASLDILQSQIRERLKTVAEQCSEDWYGAKIVPLIHRDSEWRSGDDQGSIAPYVRTLPTFSGKSGCHRVAGLEVWSFLSGSMI